MGKGMCDRYVTDVRVRDCFAGSLRCFGRAFALLARGVYGVLRLLFLRYPNPTWAVLAIALLVVSYVKIGEARSERDRSGMAVARLQHQLDSLQGKVVRYESYK